MISRWQIGWIYRKPLHKHLRPVGPRWAQCWPHEPCYLGLARNAKASCMNVLPGMALHELVTASEPPGAQCISRVSCKKGPTRHAYAWQIGPFWQDTLDISIAGDGLRVILDQVTLSLTVAYLVINRTKHTLDSREYISHPDSKVHGANMAPIGCRQEPGGPHVGPVNFAIWAVKTTLNIRCWAKWLFYVGDYIPLVCMFEIRSIFSYKDSMNWHHISK